MSDKSSESSCGWIVLNESDELPLDAEEQLVNLEPSYDALCEEVSDPIISSLSSEELEWQYEQFQDFIPPYGSQYIEEIDDLQLDSENSRKSDFINEDDDSNKLDSENYLEGDKCTEVVHARKIQCYKHSRNDHLNFVLNLMLALVTASALGLGIGHFLGWSHKCYKGTISKEATYYSNMLKAVDQSSELPEIISVRQNVKNIIDIENQDVKDTFFENLSDISCSDLEEPKHQVIGELKHQEISKSPDHENILSNIIVPETSMLMIEDVLELKAEEVILKNYSEIQISDASNNVPEPLLYPISVPSKDLNKLLEGSDYQEKSYPDSEGVSFKDLFSFNSDDNLLSKDISFNAKFDWFKKFLAKEENSNDKMYLTSQLKQDLNQVIDSLSALAVARITHVSQNYPIAVENSEVIVKYYKDFKNLLDLKLTEIDKFVSSAENKKHEKASLKHLQRLVYSLVESVDYLMKLSIKTLGRENRINIHKFSYNISKVIFNLNKRWEKHSRFWIQTIEKTKVQEIKNKFFKIENRYIKKKSQFVKEYKNDKNKRYAMKS